MGAGMLPYYLVIISVQNGCFTDPIIRGMSVFRCHLLSHEDNGMIAKILF